MAIMEENVGFEHSSQLAHELKHHIDISVTMCLVLMVEKFFCSGPSQCPREGLEIRLRNILAGHREPKMTLPLPAMSWESHTHI